MKYIVNRENWAFIIVLAIYLSAVIGYTIWSNHAFRKASVHEIDQKLMLAAKSIKFMLAPDFHDRAVDGNAISMEEEMKNRAAVSGFAFDTDLEWIYTLVEKDGKFYFAAPTVSEEEARERASWYFLPYPDIPEAFVRAFNDRATVFTEYTDQWGNFRSVAIPETSPGGRTYLACADYEIGYLKHILFQNTLISIATAFYFMACFLPFILFVRNRYRMYNKRLESINRELNDHKQHLEELVESRTAELNRSNRRLRLEVDERKAAELEKEHMIEELREALSQVKTLRGLLPICASCKNIRDDKGYWNKIETYISTHSEADFTHSICPECVKTLYPDLAQDKDDQW